jgi:uncharacterized protein involved in type VI secretion and phage assembly
VPVLPNVSVFHITLDGSDIPAEHMYHVRTIEVDCSLHMPAAATIEFWDTKIELTDDTRYKIGADIKITVQSNSAAGGDDTTVSDTVFHGVIAAIEPVFSNDNDTPYAMFCIRAYDRLYLLHRGNNTKVYVNEKDSGIASAVIGENGLSAQVHDTQAVHEHVYRDETSDYNFLKSLAERNGLVLCCEDKKVIMAPPDSLGRGTVTLSYGVDLLEFRPALSLAGQVNKVQARGWDRQEKRHVVGENASATFEPTTTGFNSRGSAMLQTAHNPRTLILTETHTAQADAEVAAKTLLNRMSAQDMTGEGVAFGNPRIKAGSTLTIKELGTRFSGDYFATRVRHRQDSGGVYTTEFWIGGMSTGTLASLVSVQPRPSSAPPHQVVGLITAVVTNNSDPKKLGRVKLKYPQLADDLESDWAALVAPGAGPATGLMLVPEVNDEVLVGFIQGDMNHPFVLGGLWNGVDAPPEPPKIADGKVGNRILKTRKGHIFRLTDEAGQEKIELIDSKGKNLFEIDSANDSITLKAAKDITIEATGDITIKGMNIKIQAQQKLDASGQMVKAEAQTQIALKGGTTAELSASGQTKISGGMVMIN